MVARNTILRKRDEEVIIVGRRELKTFKGIEKIDKLHEMHKALPKKITELASSDKNFYYKELKWIIECFINHFKSDKIAFVEFWGENFACSTHKKNCAFKCPK